MRHLIDITDLSTCELEMIADRADDIIAHPDDYVDVCAHKILATLFFEPSTRTRLSFESAMLHLGGSVLGFSSANSSSASKGESLLDTASTVSCYADIIAMRHPSEGAATAATITSSVPVINAGDGGHCHPTQTLADLLTIRRAKGGFCNLTVGMCGDLKFGRTVHSLTRAMSRYDGVHFVMISPPELRVPQYVKDELAQKGISYTETTSLEQAMPSLDILYMTRVQQERFTDKEEYLRLKDSFILEPAKLENAKRDMIIMHPLPRVNEISRDVDCDPRARYFEQVKCGRFMRMALIMFLLENSAEPRVNPAFVNFESAGRCSNARCITASEPSLERLLVTADTSGKYRCAYCDFDIVMP